MTVVNAKILKTIKGKTKAVVIPFKGNQELVEGIIDSIIIEKARKEPRLLWSDVKNKLDKKHGIKAGKSKKR
jgi:hypothetical protein